MVFVNLLTIFIYSCHIGQFINFTYRCLLISFLLGFTPCKAKQPLQGMELQEKEAQKDESIQEISLEKTYS